MMDDYVQAMEAVYAALKKADALKAFRHAMMARAEMTARNQISCNDDCVMQALRGQLTICFELADGALSALEADKAKANAAIAERFGGTNASEK